MYAGAFVFYFLVATFWCTK